MVLVNRTALRLQLEEQINYQHPFRGHQTWSPSNYSQNFIYAKVQTQHVEHALQQECISTGDVHTKLLQLVMCCFSQEED